jgi:phage-related protein
MMGKLVKQGLTSSSDPNTLPAMKNTIKVTGNFMYFDALISGKIAKKSITSRFLVIFNFILNTSVIHN